jgi:hypothetical protein
MIRTPALSALLAAACTGSAPGPSAPEPATPAATGLRIALQANVHGDIEPCG